MKKSKKPTPVIPNVLKSIVPTTAIASGIFSQSVLGAPGDLDPTFGDMGRVGPALNLKGSAWAFRALSGGESLVAGGEHLVDYYCSYYNGCHADGFIGQISPSGSLNLQLAATAVADTEVLDFALQPDGKVVAVGRTYGATRSSTPHLTVFRALSGGALDTSFADNGVLTLNTGSDAQSVILDPGGAIVIGGSTDGNLSVLRLRANGSLDASFGKGGIYTSTSVSGSASVHVLRTAAGGYRVSAGCTVLALTAAGTVDTTFGTAGLSVRNSSSGAPITCPAFASQSDGRLLLGGQEGDHAFVSRLLANGAPDPSFDASVVQADMTEATALAVDAAGSILVAGQPNPGISGALIIRLQASGLLDTLFGDGGSTWIDVMSSAARNPAIYDMSALADGVILAAGGEVSTQPQNSGAQQPLLIRLVGPTGSEGSGVIGVKQSSVAVKEQDTTAVMTVRRMGGSAGSVSVTYRTTDYTGTDAPPATSGTDYTPVNGTLTWTDGDRSDRQITVPILTAGRAEEPKRFTVTLADANTGARFGTQAVAVEVATDGNRAGELGFAQPTVTASTNGGIVQLVVNRDYYSTGAISVTLTPTAGTATSADFSATPLTLTWADGDSQSKTAAIPIYMDNGIGSGKTFTVDLTNPTGGALIGSHSHEVVNITPAIGSPASTPSSGGGGAFDWLGLLGLGWVRWLQRRTCRGAPPRS